MRTGRETSLWGAKCCTAICRQVIGEGTERIRGELLKLGIAVSARSIRRYRLPLPNGWVERRDRLGGLLHEYFLAA